MNQIEPYEPFRQYRVKSGVHPLGLGGYQAVFRFDNAYGASVVQGDMAYTSDEQEYEIAIIKFDITGEWHIAYNTPIADDVLGHLSVVEAINILEQIKALPSELAEITELSRPSVGNTPSQFDADATMSSSTGESSVI